MSTMSTETEQGTTGGNGAPLVEQQSPAPTVSTSGDNNGNTTTYAQVDLGQYIDMTMTSALQKQMADFQRSILPTLQNMVVSTFSNMKPLNSGECSSSGHSAPPKKQGTSEDPNGKRRRAKSPVPAVEDTLSIYASSAEFSQGESTQSEFEDGSAVDSDSEDQQPPHKQRKRSLKSVVVVPGAPNGATPALPSSMILPVTSAPGAPSEQGLVINPTLKAALSAAIPIEVTSTAINQNLADQLKPLWHTVLDQDKVDSIVSIIHPPANTTFIRVQRTNEEVFSMVKQPVQAQDASIQKTQSYVCKAAVSTVQIMDKLNSIKSGDALTDAVRNDIDNGLANVYMLLSHINGKLSQGRKNKLSRGIPRRSIQVYGKLLCSQTAVCCSGMTFRHC